MGRVNKKLGKKAPPLKKDQKPQKDIQDEPMDISDIKVKSLSAESNAILSRKKKKGKFELQNVPKKKDRIKMKRLLFNDQLKKNLVEELSKKKQEKERKKREKAPVVGDLNPMSETLKKIDEIIKDSEEKEEKFKKSKQKSKAKQSRTTKKLKKRKEDFMNSVKVFQAVKKHPDFVKDPLKSISTHVENKVLTDKINGCWD